MDLGMGMGIDTTNFGLFNPFQSTLKPRPRCPRPSPRAVAAPAPSPPRRPCTTSVDTGYSAFSDDPAAELANRVRKNAGLVLAVQIGSPTPIPPACPIVSTTQQPSAFTAPPASLYSTLNTAASAFTTVPVAPSAPPTPATPVQTATQSWPKTSHTTIECRYRTNLNARIQSLRQAVPALRVVDTAAAIKAGEPYPGGDASDPEDHIDARGFKIARKCSNVLGKAVKYICMLKNPENRLTHELKGLKTVLRGLVGEMELLGEWEREWVGVEDGGNANEDDAEDDEEGESDDEGGGRKRKKAKVGPAPKVKVECRPAAPVQEGEKKKRGRPRKVVPLPASATASASANSSHAGSPALSTSVPMHSSLGQPSTAAYAQRQQEIMHQQQQQQQDLAGSPRQYLLAGGPCQYLLGAFALFSFFANANVYEGGGGVMRGGVGEHRVACGEGVWARYAIVSASAPCPPTLLEKEEKGSETETETDGERSVGSVRSLSEEDGDVDADASEEVQEQAHSKAEACILDDSTPPHTAAHRVPALHVRFHHFPHHHHHLALVRTRTRTILDRTIRDGRPPTPPRAPRAPRPSARRARRPAAVGRRRRGGGAAWADEAYAHHHTNPNPHTNTHLNANHPNAKGGRAAHVGGGRGGGAAARGRETGVREGGVGGSLYRVLFDYIHGVDVNRLHPTSAADTDADASTDVLAKAAASERELARAREREEERAALEVAQGLGGRIPRLGARVGRWGGRGQEGAEGDVEKLLRAIVLYRRVFGPASASASLPASANTKGGNVNARTSRTSTAARALRRTLGSSKVFEDAGAGVEEARDRVVDLLTGEV
ncbi:hypothetical protein B0H16DRAFT_1477338 [Mycena metata]|uniref:BHLH domain-containing protein n=1 Tax=Mycena metata TaxID=1033252 RepID=A0AAD7H9Y0_9AGAR|nr:hypothetical protein B0H16DRAFT_1477338 [Mycena metata]